MDDVKFKYQPAWIIIFDFFLSFFLYGITIHLLARDTDFSIPSCIFYLIILLMLCYLLPWTIRMLLGKPAILLTNEYFVDNLFNRKIKWSNISSIDYEPRRFTRGFDRLVINLKNPDEYFDSPLKQILYKFKRLYTVNDISVVLDFVYGEKDEILHVARVYWDKSAGL